MEFGAMVNHDYRFSLNALMIGEYTAEFTLTYLSGIGDDTVARDVGRGILIISRPEAGINTIEWRLLEGHRESLPSYALLSKQRK